jgi:hypothetical protein
VCSDFLITVVMAAASADAVAQSAICEMVTPGDTAATVSRRLTGRANSHDEPWFRVFDRSRSRVIPRAKYNRLQSGWQACVPAMRALRHASEPVPRSASTAIRSLPRGSLSVARWSVLDVIHCRTLNRRSLLGLAAGAASRGGRRAGGDGT